MAAKRGKPAVPERNGWLERRSLSGQPVGDRRVLVALSGDGLAEASGANFAARTDLTRIFLAQGSAAADVTLTDDIAEIREISGGVMVVKKLGSDGRITVNGQDCAPIAGVPELALFDGANVVLATRLEEPALAVTEGLLYHEIYHGATAALIINRAPPGPERDAFFDTLGQTLTASGCNLNVLVLDSPHPLGKPDMGPENHPFLAPDAPGKDRMEIPANDHWRAPFGEGALFEALKWWFLARARAVLQLDVTDILAPRADAGDPSAFDRCDAAKSGVILLAGHRTYPWRVRNDDVASFGDHICRQFDTRRGIARWGVAPQKAGLENTWRTIRIAYAKPEAGEFVRFYRAMAIRVPGRKASELAPKTSLVENDDLIAMSRDIFGFKPVRAAVSNKVKAPKAAIKAGRTAIITTMKNEGPFILEWIAYHRAIGVDDFLVYTNDCTDGTDTLLDLLQDKGILQHRDNPFKESGLKPQHAALQAGEAEPIMQNAGWAICMDVDEFINIKVGDGTLDALYREVGDANMISLTWRLFGNADVHEYRDDFMLAQFDKCAPEIVRKPHQAWGFKTLFRNIGIYKKLGVHRPKGLKPDLWDQIHWLNGSGRRMPKEMLRNGWRSTLDTYGYDMVCLNHYAVRSAESFLVKRDRGRVNHVDRDQGLSYWFRMNHNLETEPSIQRMIPALRAEFDRLMADPDIAAQHHACVLAHRAKIDALRATENYENFYGELTSERMQRLSRMHHHFGSAVFNAGPGSIPDEVAMTDHASDFFFTVEHTGEAEH